MSSVKLPSLDLRAINSNRRSSTGVVYPSHSARSSRHSIADLSTLGPEYPSAAAAASSTSHIDPSTSSATATAAAAAVSPPPPLSSLVSASLAAAAHHERAIAKWAREIQREVDEYRMRVNKEKKMAAKKAMMQQQQQQGQGAAMGGGRKGGAYMSRKDRAGFSSHPSSPPSSSLFHDVGAQPLPPRGGAASFYSSKLTRVPSGLVSGQGQGGVSGAATARLASPPAHVRQASMAGTRGGAYTSRRKQSVVAFGGDMQEAKAQTGGEEANQATLSALFVDDPSHSAAPASQSALQPLPPSLSLYPSSSSSSGSQYGGASGSTMDPLDDESAAFKSPALYMDMKMRQLFHADSLTSSSSTPSLTSSQKAHVLLHLLDVLGQLVEPDSQQAYTILSSTLRDLILAAEYKNLIPINVVPPHHHHSNHGGTSGKNAKGKGITSGNSSASLSTRHKEQLRRDRTRWTPSGQLRPEDIDQLLPTKSLIQALKDGELEQTQQMDPDALHSARGRVEQGKLEKRRTQGKGDKVPHPPNSSLPLLDVDLDADLEDVRRAPPSIVFEGDYSAAAAAASLQHLSSIAPGAVLPFKTHLARASPAAMANMKQVPASALEVAWALKKEVEGLCERLEGVEAATASLREEETRRAAEHSYLQDWHSKKSLQLHLFSRSEENLLHEIHMLKHLILDLKEELESLYEENTLMSQDYLSRGLVFGGSFALEQHRYEEEHRNYPQELRVARHQLEGLMAHIEQLNADCQEMAGERDLLLTRIEVLEQAVNMMHNESDEEEEDEEGEEKEAPAQSSGPQPSIPLPSPDSLASSGYPYRQLRPDDLRGRGSSNLLEPVSLLRFDGWYPHLHFSPREVEVWIKELWSVKSLLDERAKQVGGSTKDFNSFFEEYARKRWGKKGKGRKGKETTASSSSSLPSDYPLHEFLLNFFTSLECHFIDQDFLLFIQVVRGELHEAHYRDQMQMLAHFKDALFRWDLEEHELEKEAGGIALMATTGVGQPRVDGLISKERFIRGLKEFFPRKPNRNMEELVDILERDCMSEGQVDCSKILGESDGGPSNFLDAIRAQYLMEIEHFVTRIRNDLLALYEVRRVEREKEKQFGQQASSAIGVASTPAGHHHKKRSSITSLPLAFDLSSPTLTAYDIRSVLRSLDLDRSTHDLTDLLKRGCQEPYLNKDTPVQVEQFVKNLVKTGLVHVTGHWKRIPVKQRREREEEGKSRENTLQQILRGETSSSSSSQFASSSSASSHRLAMNRRASMDDESLYVAARVGGALPLDAAVARPY